MAVVKTGGKPNPQITDAQWAESQKYITAEAQNDLGLCELTRKNYDKAAAYFKSAVEGDPQPAWTLRERAGDVCAEEAALPGLCVGFHRDYGGAAQPDERRNRIDDPACGDRLRELKTKLETWFADYVEPLLLFSSVGTLSKAICEEKLTVSISVEAVGRE